MKTNRKEKRYCEKLLVIIKEKENPLIKYGGVTSNISKNGICIVSSTHIPINKKISVLIATDSNFLAVRGASIWTYTQPDTKSGTGISITSPPVEYIQFVNKVINV